MLGPSREATDCEARQTQVCFRKAPAPRPCKSQCNVTEVLVRPSAFFLGWRLVCVSCRDARCHPHHIASRITHIHTPLSPIHSQAHVWLRQLTCALATQVRLEEMPLPRQGLVIEPGREACWGWTRRNGAQGPYRQAQQADEVRTAERMGRCHVVDGR